jgi:hypothetical protein
VANTGVNTATIAAAQGLPTIEPDRVGPYSWGPGDSGYRHAPPVVTAPTPVTAPARYRARLQVLTDTGAALLLLFGTAGWQVEGVYD